jgi:hypothetical protein
MVRQRGGCFIQFDKLSNQWNELDYLTAPAKASVSLNRMYHENNQSQNMDHQFTIGSPDNVICNETDVLLGRGRSSVNWPGKLRFRTIVFKYRPAYLSSPKIEKFAITEQIIVEVLSNGGRFLREISPGKWLPDKMAFIIEKTQLLLRRKCKEPHEGLPSAGDAKKLRPSGDHDLILPV